jgi:hypothetical protein
VKRIENHLSKTRHGMLQTLEASVYDYLKASVHTQELCPKSGETQRPVERSHIMMVPSSSPEAMYRPSGDIASDKTILL